MSVRKTLPKSTFTSELLKLNGFSLPGFNKWLFDYGMEYKDTIKWWGDRRQRPSPHEGVDFMSFSDHNGQVQELLPGTKIPALFPAKIIRVIDDMVAQTIIVAHDLRNKSDKFLHSFYAHITPVHGIEPGVEVFPDVSIGVIAIPPTHSRCPAHLHLSAAWINPEKSNKILNWKMITAENSVQFINPLELINP